MTYIKFNVVTELRKAVRGRKTKVDKDTLLRLAAEQLLQGRTITR